MKPRARGAGLGGPEPAPRVVSSRAARVAPPASGQLGRHASWPPRCARRVALGRAAGRRPRRVLPRPAHPTQAL